MKQVVLIELYLPHVTKEMSIGVLLILQKLGEGRFFPKKERVGKKSRGKFRDINLCLMLIFVFINPRNITIQGIYNSSKF